MYSPTGLIFRTALLFFVLFSVSCSHETDTDADFKYKVEDVDQIDRIELRHAQGQAITLTRDGDRWRLNGGYYARENAVKNLLDAMSRVELKFIPVEAARKAMMEDLDRQGIDVKAFDRRGSEMISYSVGGMTPDERGTYLLKEGSEMPAVAAIPGWEGGLRIRYWMAPIEWQDRTVFQVSSSDLKEISLEYFEQPASSFRLRKISATEYECEDFSNSRPTLKVQTAAAQRYVKEFQSVGAEAVINHEDVEGFTSDAPPWCQLRVMTTDQTYSYSIYPLDTAPTARGSIRRYHFINERGDIFMVQDALVHDVFLGYSYFQDHQITQ